MNLNKEELLVVKYVKEIFFVGFVLMILLLARVVAVGGYGVETKVKFILILLLFSISSLGAYMSWSHLRQIAECRKKANILFALHLLSYALIVYFYYQLFHVLTVEDENSGFLPMDIVFFPMFVSNFPPTMFLEKMRAKYFRYDGGRFVIRQKPP